MTRILTFTPCPIGPGTAWIQATSLGVVKDEWDTVYCSSGLDCIRENGWVMTVSVKPRQPHLPFLRLNLLQLLFKRRTLDGIL